MIDLNPVLPSLKQRMQRLLGKHIELLWIPGAKLDKVRGETVNLEHALLELALRARLSLPFGGKVMVETANVDLTTPSPAKLRLHPGRYVLLEMTCVRLNSGRELLFWSNLRRIAFFYRHNSHRA